MIFYYFSHKILEIVQKGEKMASLGNYVYVTFGEGTAGQWPATLYFEYPRRPGGNGEQKTFESLLAARQFLKEILKDSDVLLSYSVQYAVSLERSLERGSQLE